MKFIDYYQILGIYTKGNLHIPSKNITDEEILIKYQTMRNKIVSFLQDTILMEENTEEEKQRKNRKIEKLKESLEQLNESYKHLETKEKREEYEEECDKYLTSEILLRKLARYQEKSLEEIEEKHSNISNRAIDVKEDKNHIPYTPVYEGKEIQLLELAKINFTNGINMKDQLYKYILLLKKHDELMPLGYDFYSDNIIVEKLEEPEYRAVFCEAIKRAIEKKERYIGEINIDSSKKYFINIDDGRKSAAKEYELQLENARKKQNEKEELR